MDYSLRFIIASLFTMVLGIAFFWTLEMGMDGNELVECNQWNLQSKSYANFYLTQWQDDQCKHHGIAIDAPVQQAPTTALAVK